MNTHTGEISKEPSKITIKREYSCAIVETKVSKCLTYV